jgi:hypothetical protein
MWLRSSGSPYGMDRIQRNIGPETVLSGSRLKTAKFERVEYGAVKRMGSDQV